MKIDLKSEKRNGEFVVSYDFSKLVLIQNSDEKLLYGFDLLDNHKFVALQKSKCSKIDPHCNLIKKLLVDNSSKINLAESVCFLTDEQAKYLDISERNLFRLKNNI